MTAKEYLNQVRELDADIQKDMMEKDTWMSLATSLSIDPAQEKLNPNHATHAPYEKCVENAQELEQQIKERKAELGDMKIKIAGEIQGLLDHDEVIILLMRYVALMKWEDIFEKFGLSESPIMKKHSKALSHFEEVYPWILEIDS